MTELSGDIKRGFIAAVRLLYINHHPRVFKPSDINMNSLIFLVIAMAVGVFAAPQHDPSKDAIILKYESDNVGLDSYNFAFETSDGTSRQEQGQLKNAGQENEALSVSGTVSWIGADGQQYTLTYIADENGFQPSGAHLPQVPQ